MRKQTFYLAVAAITSLATMATASPLMLVTTTNTVFKVDTAGNAAPFATGLTNARGLTIGPDGVLYVADYGAGNVKTFDATTGAAIGTFGSGFTNPYDIEFQGGTAYVSDWT